MLHSNYWVYHNTGVSSRPTTECKHEWINISLLTQKLVCKMCDYEMDDEGNVRAPKPRIPDPVPEQVTQLEDEGDEPVSSTILTREYLLGDDLQRKLLLERIKKAKGIFSGPPVMEGDEEYGNS